MSAEIISFTQRRKMAAQAHYNAKYRPERKTMHSLVFRSRDVILEVDEALLLEDVRFDFEKAERKLFAAQRQLENVKVRAADEIRKLTAVTGKLGAAVEAARLSMKGGFHEAPTSISPEA